MRTVVAGLVECRSHLYQAARDKFAVGASSPILPTLCTVHIVCTTPAALYLCSAKCILCTLILLLTLSAQTKLNIPKHVVASSAFTLFLPVFRPYYSLVRFHASVLLEDCILGIFAFTNYFLSLQYIQSMIDWVKYHEQVTSKVFQTNCGVLLLNSTQLDNRATRSVGFQFFA